MSNNLNFSLKDFYSNFAPVLEDIIVKLVNALILKTKVVYSPVLNLTFILFSRI